MGKVRRTATLPRILAPTFLCLWLAGMGGCAVLPFALTTGASLAMPQSASLALSGIKGAYETAAIASDERDVNTIVRDNMLSLKGKSALVAMEGTADVHVCAYDGDLFAVGVVDSEAVRSRIIRTLATVRGAHAVKGLIRVDAAPAGSAARTADDALTNRVRAALARNFFHKNADVDVQAVEGEVCLMGVVGTYADALDVIQYVETISGAQALSLLVIHEENRCGRPQTNRRYVLTPGGASKRCAPGAMDDDPPLPTARIPIPPAPRSA